MASSAKPDFTLEWLLLPKLLKKKKGRKKEEIAEFHYIKTMKYSLLKWYKDYKSDIFQWKQEHKLIHMLQLHIYIYLGRSWRLCTQ